MALFNSNNIIDLFDYLDEMEFDIDVDVHDAFDDEDEIEDINCLEDIDDFLFD